MLGFLSAAATDPTTLRSVVVAMSSDKPLRIMLRFILLVSLGYFGFSD
jgi:hypothetical protein